MAKIEFEDKVALIVNPDIPDINKVKADDINEIKSVVNENDDKFLTNGLNVSNEVDEDYRVNFLKSKNLLDFSELAQGSFDGTNTSNRVSTRQVLYLEAGTYTFSTNINTTNFYFGIAVLNSPPPSASYSYASGWKQTIPFTFEITTPGYVCIYFRRSGDNALNISDISGAQCQLEVGSTATSYEPYTRSINVDGENIYSKASNTYSTYEINTGKKWINGKPIYRKVVQFNPSTSAMETKTAHNISNLSEILPTSSCMLHRINNQFVPFSMFYPNTNQYLDWSMGWQVDSTHIFTWLGSSMRGQIDTTNYGAVAILEYTKTTD